MNVRSAQAPAMYVGDHKHVCLRNGTHKPPRARSLSEPPQDVAFSSLFCFFVLSACACSPDVTVTSYSPTPFVSHRGILMQTIVLSKSSTKQKSFGKGVATSSRLGCMYVCSSRTNCCWLARLIRGLILSRIGPSSGRHYVAASNQGGTPP